ncbi:MAG: anaerobic ribonucleoside-triphosphate reductase activating protein [Desulfosalsimonadaceae bacterium]
MNIGGFEKYSFIDFPGCISSVVFTRGCNFCCPYCHNPELVQPGCEVQDAAVSEEDVLSFLEKRRKYVDGVVITGGEPFLQPDLPEFCQQLKMLGFSIKIDTNGSRPEMLAEVIRDGLADYIAMDVKTDPERYAPLIARELDPERIRRSIEIIIGAGLPHEFRTTCVRPIVDEPAVRVIAEMLRGASLHALQKPRSEKVLDPAFFEQNQWQFSDAELDAFQSILSQSVHRCIIR